MALSSMTGFARGQGVAGAYAWSWEIKSVNAKGLDLRFRLPPGWDAVELPARSRANDALARGTVYANLTVERKGAAPAVKINEPVLAAVIGALKRLDGKVAAAPPTLDGILSLKGVMRSATAMSATKIAVPPRRRSSPASPTPLAALVAKRREEGAALGQLLGARLAEIAALTARAEAAPGRKPEAIKARLAEQIAVLAVGLRALRRRPPAPGGDAARQQSRHPRGARPARRPCRAGAEADRRRRRRSAAGSTSWRRNSTANRIRLTAKSNDVELTNIGLELKTVVEQFREQVQNLE